MLDIFFKIKMLQQSHKFITSFFLFFRAAAMTLRTVLLSIQVRQYETIEQSQLTVVSQMIYCRIPKVTVPLKITASGK